VTFVDFVVVVAFKFLKEIYMPVRKARLSRAEGARYLTDLKQLQAAELEVTILEESRENSDAIDIDLAPPNLNFLRELRCGRTRCAILARLLGRVGGLTLEDFEIASEWDPEWIIPSCEEEQLCRWFDLRRDKILNYRIEDGLRFHHPGDVAKGYLLAVSQRPIADKCPDGMVATLDITFTDQYGHSHCVQTEASLQRSAHRVDYTAGPIGTGLYGPGSRQREVRVHQTIADTVKNPTKPNPGRVDETPSRVKNVVVGRKDFDAG
jgi:hypothetical protein